jgi:hypothetical protein
MSQTDEVMHGVCVYVCPQITYELSAFMPLAVIFTALF